MYVKTELMQSLATNTHRCADPAPSQAEPMLTVKPSKSQAGHKDSAHPLV